MSEGRNSLLARAEEDRREERASGMTRFSVSGEEEEDEDEPLMNFVRSSTITNLKRRRSVLDYCSEGSSEDEFLHPPRQRLDLDQSFHDDLPFVPSQEDEDEDEQLESDELTHIDIQIGEEEEQEEGFVSEHDSPSVGPTPTEGSVSSITRDRSISVVLTDPDVLDCSICFDPLTLPVFQCDNGHIACSTCCTKIKNKCPSCSWPIGYNRCRAIEKVLESVKIACLNAQYGCKETVAYSNKKDHERSCTYSPCSCPIFTCDFVSSSTKLYHHFKSQHLDSAVCFDYNSSFPVTLLNWDNNTLFLQERNDNVIFILYFNIETFGYVVWVTCIWPCPFKGFFYDILAKTDESSHRLQSFASCSQVRVDDRPSTGYLIIPKKPSGYDSQVNLDICIRRNDAAPA